MSGIGIWISPVGGPAGNPIRYLLRDEFTTDRAAGAVNGTPAEPGPGTRIVNLDTENTLSISGGKMVAVNIAIPVWNNPSWVLSQGVPRSNGQMVIVNYTSVVFGSMSIFGTRQAPAVSTSWLEGWFDIGGANMYVEIDGIGIYVFPTVTGVAYPLVTVLRTPGAYYLAKVGGYWKLYWIEDSIFNYNPVYFIYTHRDKNTAIDYIRFPQTLWLPTPLCYDTFTRADGALGSSETTGPDGQAVAARAWADTAGTWRVSTNKAVCSALAGGIGIATVDADTRNVLASAATTRAAGNVGVVASYVDANNYIYAYHDGTNVMLVKVVGGVPTTLISAATAYVAGAILLIVIDGNSVSLYYNGAQVGTTQTVSDAGLMTATKHGLFTSNTGNSLDNFLVFPRGTGGEYSALNKWSA